jgi:ubiquinone/menaquinone biosynthesis C-methylase UbiE
VSHAAGRPSGTDCALATWAVDGHDRRNAGEQEDTVSDTDRGQVSASAAEVYDAFFVPALFAQWTDVVLDVADVRSGHRVLDVGCGTGVLTRAAHVRVGARGHVAGVDPNDGMLTIARRAGPDIEWQTGLAEQLPYPDHSFDRTVSQFALMYFPDRSAALSEMWRTLAPGGRIAVASWAALDHARAYRMLVDIAARQCGREAADVLAAPFVLGDHSELAKLFVDSGISGATVALHEGLIRFASVKEFVRIEVKGSPLADMLSDNAMEALAAESEDALAEFVVPSGEIIMPMDAHIVTASKG